MQMVDLEVLFRNKTGTKENKKLRRKNLIPAILYGKEISPVPVCVNLKDFENILESAGKNALINLSVKKDSLEKENYTVIIKEIQEHPLEDTIIHIDFQAISLKERMKVKVPLEFVGEPKGVKEGGMLEHLLWEIEIECLPAEIPANIQIDISNIGINQHLYAKDISLPENIKLLTDPEEIIVQVIPEKGIVEEIKPEEEEKPAEPEIIKEKKETEKEE